VGAEESLLPGRLRKVEPAEARICEQVKDLMFSSRGIALVTEIDAAWKQYRFNPRAIADIEFRGVQMKKGKLIDMSIKDKTVEPFDDHRLFKLLRRAGNRNYGTGSEEFSDLDYLRASGLNSRIQSIKCWFDPNSQFFNGFQVTYECSNGQTLKAAKNFVSIGQYVEDELTFHRDEYIVNVTVYFAHFISGIQIETNRSTKLFGVAVDKNVNPNNVAQILTAPYGAAILAFFGSHGRLFETIGCYCVTLDSTKIRKSLLRKKPKHSKHASSNSQENEEALPQDTTPNAENSQEEPKSQNNFFQKLKIGAK